MNFDFATKINPELARLDFEKAIKKGESELAKLPHTVFHDVMGNSLTRQADELAAWMEDFYLKASDNLHIKAVYCEMNEFDINTDAWFIDAYAYASDGGLSKRDMDWLSDWDADSRSTLGTLFGIEGFESLQEAFATIETNSRDLQNARDWSEQLIIARFMELMAAAYQVAKKQSLKWAAIPLYFTEHSYDFIVRSA